MGKSKRYILLAVGLVLLGLVVALGIKSPFLPAKAPLKKDLGRTLEITPGDLVSLMTGSDAGGCEWHSSKTEDERAYRKAVEKLLRMAVFEMTPEAPEGCKTAYYAADEINAYKFVTGQLTIPPSGQYPPSPTGTFSHFYRVVFKRNDRAEEREFCLEEAEFLAVVGKIKENPRFVDCEI